MEKTNSDELKRERASLLATARSISDAAENENRDVTEDEQRQCDDAIASADALDKRIEAAERDESIALREARYKSRPPLTRPDPQDNGGIGMSDKEARQYSLVKAIMAFATGDWREAGMEREASETVAKRSGRSARGFFVPHDAMVHRGIERRDLTKGTGSAGGFTVDTELLGQSFIDLLRNRMVVRQAGATVLAGLTGDIAIPRQSGGATAFWVAENANLTESQQAFEQVAMSPKSVGAYTDISRKLLLQASIDVEALVRNDLATVIALAIDRAALHGSGAGSEPSGLAVIAGVANVDHGATGGPPTWAKIVEFETAVASANADLGSLAYVTNAKVRGKMKTIFKDSPGTGIPLWGESAEPLNSYRALVSNQVRSDLVETTTGLSAAFFGNWADLFIGTWGALDVLIDPYTGGIAGTLRIIVFQDVDIAVRHPESFARALDINTT